MLEAAETSDAKNSRDIGNPFTDYNNNILMKLTKLIGDLYYIVASQPVWGEKLLYQEFYKICQGHNVTHAVAPPYTDLTQMCFP